MGPFTVGVPRPQQQGAFVEDKINGSCSKLVRCDREEDEAIAQNMAGRLSQKLSTTVFVSCHLQGKISLDPAAGTTNTYLLQAAAYAERELFRILKDEIG